MDHKPSPIDSDAVHFTYPSPAEIERHMARGRALRAETMADLFKSGAAMLRRAFGHASTAANHSTGDLRPHAR